MLPAFQLLHRPNVHLLHRPNVHMLADFDITVLYIGLHSLVNYKRNTYPGKGWRSFDEDVYSKQIYQDVYVVTYGNDLPELNVNSPWSRDLWKPACRHVNEYI